ncbi:uncharacterized protein [Henckelia pumila]|uniref:uncharacterized protein n=1 Tax=Henckelia pumila TaxID=405737 RepID=UPI003C6DFB13
MDFCSLQDLHGIGDFFTWVNRRAREHLIFERLDRYVASFDWRILFPVARVQSLEFFHSDHRPILLDLGISYQPIMHINFVFRFENHWATVQECAEVVEQGWCKSDSSLPLPARLLRSSETLRSWAKNRFGNIPKKLKQKRRDLNMLKTQNRWHGSERKIVVLECEIEALASKEESYWKQQSRATWLAQGDRNSKYFHACASARRAKNHIWGLVSTHGDWCTEPSSMAAIIESYFSDLFSSDNPTSEDTRKILDCVIPRIDGNLNLILTTPFSKEEVRKALFDMHPDKAPGPDGMSVFFYQKFWNIIREEVTMAVLRVLNDGAELAYWNNTVVALVPKIKEPLTLKNFRPISLCNICYKIVARAVTNRLRPILNKSMNDFQSAFLPGRLILDNIILSFEILHWIRCRKVGKTGYAALKLDMSKAYDRVKWSFLIGMMLKLGFDQSWVELIMRCVSSVHYSFSLNGDLVGNVSPTRGLRHGDPLSPYLFVLCAHGLSSSLISLEYRNLLKGVKVASSSPSISHLFFADDSLMFFRATMADTSAIRNCLNGYEKASGQLVNFEKSSLSFSPNTDENMIHDIKNMLCIPVVQGHEFYLGLPVYSARSKNLQFRYLVERVVNRTLGWGLSWRVGDGSKIAIQGDRWIYGKEVCFAQPHRTGEFVNVNSLIMNGRWNEPLGNYSVKGGYTADMGFFETPQSSSALHSSKWWQFIWALSIPPKVRIFWWKDFKNVSRSSISCLGVETNESPSSWSAPPLNLLRLDVDAAFNDSVNGFAIGGVIRNHEGQPILAFGKRIRKPPSIVYAELEAIHTGLLIARVNQLQIHFTYSDSLLAVQVVTCPTGDLSYAGAIAEEINCLLGPDVSCFLRHVRSSANGVAHSLDSFAFTYPSQFVWMRGNFPFWLINLVIKDIS